MSSRSGHMMSDGSDGEDSQSEDEYKRSMKSAVTKVQKPPEDLRDSDSESEDSSSSSSSSSSNSEDEKPDSDSHRNLEDQENVAVRKRLHDVDSEPETKDKRRKHRHSHNDNRDEQSHKNSDDQSLKSKRGHGKGERHEYKSYRESHRGRDRHRDRSDHYYQDSHKERRGEKRDKYDDHEAELERRRKEREKRHREIKQQEEERRSMEEEKENFDISSNSTRKKGDEVSANDQLGKSRRGMPSVDKSAPHEEQDMAAFLKSKRGKSGDDDALMTRTGGAYIPPARLRMMQANITDKASEAFQRISWEALKKSINGLINKVNVANMISIVRELFQENIVRGRGLLAKSVITAQKASPTFTNVYAALVAIINTKFPQIGELILKRLIIQFKKGYRRNDKTLCLTSTRFLAHLVNQQVAHEIVVLEQLTLLLDNPSDDSVEVTVGFLKECGQKLTEVSPRGITAIFERLRTVLHEGSIDVRTQYMVEVMFAVRKDGFKDHPAVIEELDLVEEDDQFTHMISLEDATNSDDILNVFKFDPQYTENEEKYKVLKKEILDEGSSDEDSGSGSGSGSGSDEDSDDENDEEKTMIIDKTETNMVAFRRTIYLTIQSSLDYQECVHKILKMDVKPGMEEELMAMILDCCAQQRTYEKFFGLLAQRFCMIDKKYIEPSQKIFIEQYETCHRLETNKLRNVSKFFGHLLHTDSISWEVVQAIHLNEEETTSSSRIFIKILFQELSEYMGLPKLHDRLNDPTLATYFEGLFPRDNPRNTRFSINFFTSIGLGGLTDELRQHLKTMPKPAPKATAEPSSSSSSDDSSSSSSSSSHSSSDSSDSDFSSSDSSGSKKGRKRRKGRQHNSKSKAESKQDKELVRQRRLELERECQRLEELYMEKKQRKNKDEHRTSDIRSNTDRNGDFQNDHGRENDVHRRRDKIRRSDRNNDSRHEFEKNSDKYKSRSRRDANSRSDNVRNYDYKLDQEHDDDIDKRRGRDYIDRGRENRRRDRSQ